MHACPGQAGEVSDRHRAKPQVGRQIAGPLGARKVARLAVAVQPGQEVVQQGLRARHPGRHLQVRHGLEIHFGQGGHGRGPRPAGRTQGRRRRGQVPGVALHRVGLQVKGLQLLEPGAFVGRKHAVWRVIARHHLAALKDHMVFEGVQHDAVIAQAASHGRIPSQGRRLIVVVGVDVLHPQLRRQLRDFNPAGPVPDDQSHLLRVRYPGGQGQLSQRLVQLHQRFADERHPPVLAGQRVQDVGVEHESAPHLAAAFQGVEEGGVVGVTQITPKPHQTRQHRFAHGVVRKFVAKQGRATKIQGCPPDHPPPST